ncbi:cellulose binding domain-containing protein [Micromonospora sp. NBC_01813]|uniref:cellulose binding domain-containing protein n=1 Tax=Micromonospora sp. NBC_01813 TaxID=2975988 RepID=UPI002DDC75A7|nr:cellulose binding domain-containing protein [Micromonospora sp. NBC_01813]WSA09904.1 cellulose binding domain-containing protein [Micromonospora sp. NBC_01813]
MVVIFLVAAGCVPVQTRVIGELPPPPSTLAPEPEPRLPASPPSVNTGGQLVAAAPPPSGEAILAPAPPSPTPSPTPTPVPATPAMPPPTTGPALSTVVPPPSADPHLTGRYRVLDKFGDGFIAEVLVVNSSGQGRDWTVTLRFPGNVGRLYAAWVEGAPQATMSRSGQDYIFTSGVPVAGHSSVPLRFHFERRGHGADPDRCAVNGVACQVR